MLRAPTRGGAGARRPHRAARRGADAELRRAPARPGPRSAGAADVDDVAAKFRLSIEQIARRRPRSAASPRAPRGRRHARRPPTSTSARATPPHRGSASSPRGSTPALQLGRPRAARAPARAAALDLRLPAPPRPRALRSGATSGPSRARQGLKVLFAGESGTGKTMAGAGARRASSASTSSASTSPPSSRSTSGRPRRTSTAIFERRRGLQRDPVLRRGRRALRQALRGLGRARPLRQHRGRLPAAADGGATRARSSWPRTSGSNIDDAFLRRLDFVVDFPFPEPEDRKRIWRLLLPERGAAGRRRRPRLPRRRSSSSRAARSATARWPPPSWPPTRAARSGCATSCARGRAGVRQAGPADARGRLRAVPRAHRARPLSVHVVSSPSSASFASAASSDGASSAPGNACADRGAVARAVEQRDQRAPSARR